MNPVEYEALRIKASIQIVELVNAMTDEGLHPKDWTLILLLAVSRIDAQQSEAVKIEIVKALFRLFFPDCDVAVNKTVYMSSDSIN